MKSTDERVAVKLKYIDLQYRFTGDILTIRMILYALGKIFPKFEFGWMIDSVKTNLERELNFKLEGENADLCYAQLSPYLKYIYVPKVFWEYTTNRVLVMEYIDGIKISDLDKIKESKLSLKEVDTKLVEAMAFQIFHSGFVHADPHVCYIDLTVHFVNPIMFSYYSQEISMFDQIPKLQPNPMYKLFYSIMVYM